MNHHVHENIQTSDKRCSIHENKKSSVGLKTLLQIQWHRLVSWQLTKVHMRIKLLTFANATMWCVPAEICLVKNKLRWCVL